MYTASSISGWPGVVPYIAGGEAGRGRKRGINSLLLPNCASDEDAHRKELGTESSIVHVSVSLDAPLYVPVPSESDYPRNGEDRTNERDCSPPTSTLQIDTPRASDIHFQPVPLRVPPSRILRFAA